MLNNAFIEWNRQVSHAVKAVGTADYPQIMERAIRALVDFDLIVFFAYVGSNKPICLYHNLNEQRAATAINTYKDGLYLLDPFYHVAVNTRMVGAYGLRDIAPDKFYSTKYYKQHYAMTEILDEVGFICRPTTAFAS